MTVFHGSREHHSISWRGLGLLRQGSDFTLVLASWPCDIVTGPASQIHDGKSTLSQPFSVTNYEEPDRVWSCPGFPNSWRKIHPQPAIFRHEFGKPWSCLILSSTDRVWSWSECLNSWRRRRRRRRTKRNSMVLDVKCTSFFKRKEFCQLSWFQLVFQVILCGGIRYTVYGMKLCNYVWYIYVWSGW